MGGRCGKEKRAAEPGIGDNTRYQSNSRSMQETGGFHFIEFHQPTAGGMCAAMCVTCCCCLCGCGACAGIFHCYRHGIAGKLCPPMHGPCHEPYRGARYHRGGSGPDWEEEYYGYPPGRGTLYTLEDRFEELDERGPVRQQPRRQARAALVAAEGERPRRTSSPMPKTSEM